MNEVKGQIIRGSKLGEHIYNIARRSDVLTIVDIGTWLGLGSTKCIYDAVIGKPNKYVISLECNRLRHQEAKINLGFLPTNFRLIHGTIIDYIELAPLMNELKDKTLKTWLKDDLDWLTTAPNVFNLLPDKIDLCVIDGGEFSGNREFNKLWKKCKFIVLDDTNAIKHKDTKKFILSKPNTFKIIEDNITERNGFLICENLGYVKDTKQ
jgi:hypothetical protein